MENNRLALFIHGLSFTAYFAVAVDDDGGDAVFINTRGATIIESHRHRELLSSQQKGNQKRFRSDLAF